MTIVYAVIGAAVTLFIYSLVTTKDPANHEEEHDEGKAG